MSKFFYILFAFIYASWATVAYAEDTVKEAQSLNFGTYRQTAPNATITIGTNGTISSSSGVQKLVATEKNGELRYTVGHPLHSVTLHPENTVVEIAASNCTMTVNSFVVDPVTFNLSYLFGNSNVDVYVGATLTINGECLPGTYTGTAAISGTCWGESAFNYKVQTANPSVSVTIANTPSIEKTQDMDFGTIVSPESAGTVALSYNDTRTASNGLLLVNSGAARSARFRVEGVVGATVNLSLPSSIIINSGSNQMTVNSFNSDTPSSFVLDSETKDIALGATLNVPARAAAGDYSGTFTVTVSY